MAKTDVTDFDMQIEIDAETDEVLWRKGGKDYRYTVQELEDKDLIQRMMNAGTDITVYSQDQAYTLEEYLQLKEEMRGGVDNEL